jgi:hypothetical protein
MRSLAARLGLLLVGLVLAGLLLEVLFRAGGLVARLGRAGPAAAGEYELVLCVGDSHTWGRGRGYPAALATLLAARSPRYRVVNLGVPGSNTAQLRNRFADYLELYRPRVVVHWAGINNAYNRSETEVWREADVAPTSPGRRLLERSRTLRFVRVWLHQRELSRQLAAAGAYASPEVDRSVEQGGARRQTRRFAGREDVFRTTFAPALPREQQVRVTELDLRWMIERAARAGVPLVAISYGLPGAWLEAADEGIERASRATGAPLVRSERAARRLLARARSTGAPPPRLYDETVHPSQALYDEIAVLVLETLDARGLLDGPGRP